VLGGIKLTKAGKRFLEHSEVVLAEFDRAMKAAVLAGCGDEGEISIGVEAPLTEAYLHDLLQTYRGLYKDVSIQIIQESKTKLLWRMLRGEIDFAFVHAKPFGSDFDIGSDDIDSEISWQTKLFVALPQTHPFVEESVIDLEMLKSEHILLGAYGC
jgi:DNA-binding transcriptional LysR family regulator